MLKTLPVLMCLAVLCVLTACKGSVPDYLTDKPCGLELLPKGYVEMTNGEPTLTDEYIEEVIVKHEALFWRQPNVWGFGAARFRDADGKRTGPLGITIDVTEKVDQNTLPGGDRSRSRCRNAIMVRAAPDHYGTLHVPRPVFKLPKY